MTPRSTHDFLALLENRFPYTELRTRPMKGDFYNSSTHGRIRLSARGRQLLAAEREAAQNAIRDGDFRGDDQALSKARAELACYMSHLEDNQRGMKTATEMLAESYGIGPTRLDAIRAETDRKLGQLRHSLFVNFLKPGTLMYMGTDFAHAEFYNPIRYKKETPVTPKTEDTGAGAPPAEKTRSQLIGEATHELVHAQKELEAMVDGSQIKGTPDLYIGGAGSCGHYLRQAVAELVKEQWETLAKKALARAKARVAKAEKAVAALLEG